MNKEERMLHMIAILTVARDDMEELTTDLPFTQKLKNLSNQWLKEANKKLDLIASKDQELHQQYGNVLLKYEEIRQKVFLED